MSVDTDTDTDTRSVEQRIAELEEENCELRARLRKLETKLEEQESPSSTHGQFDHHDAAVLDALAGHEGTTIDRQNLKQLYRKCTNLRRQNTIHNRVTDLVASELFEKTSANVWQFVGDDDG